MRRKLFPLRQKQRSLPVPYTTCFLAVIEEQRRLASDRLDRKRYPHIHLSVFNQCNPFRVKADSVIRRRHILAFYFRLTISLHIESPEVIFELSFKDQRSSLEQKIPFRNLRRVLKCIFAPPNLVTEIELISYIDLLTYLFISK